MTSTSEISNQQDGEVQRSSSAGSNDYNVTEWRKCFSRVSSMVPYSDEQPFRDELKHANRVIELLYKEVQSLRTPDDERVKGIKDALDNFFELLTQDSEDQWCFNSLSRDAAKFQARVQALNRLRLLPVQPAQEDWIFRDAFADFRRAVRDQLAKAGIKTNPASLDSELVDAIATLVKPAASTPTALTNDETRKDAPEEVLVQPELSCPFCGGLEIVNCYDDGLYWKRCRNCGATGPETTKYSGAEGESFTDWNSRAATVSNVAVATQQIINLFLEHDSLSGEVEINRENATRQIAAILNCPITAAASTEAQDERKNDE